MDSDTPQSLALQKLAIDACLNCEWDEAVKLNKQIIKNDPKNVDALNRSAKAYMELGRFNLAKKYYSESLKHDPYNPIASKNLKIIKSFKKGDVPVVSNGHNKVSPDLFLQEPGKTKIVSLLKVAEPQKLSKAFCGMQVETVVKNRKITVIDSSGTYLGVLPDDVSHNLIRLMSGGNKYEMYIKSVKVNGLSLLIREVFRSKKFKNQPSFLANSTYPQANELINLNADSDDEEEVSDEAES